MLGESGKPVTQDRLDAQLAEVRIELLSLRSELHGLRGEIAALRGELQGVLREPRRGAEAFRDASATGIAPPEVSIHRSFRRLRIWVPIYTAAICAATAFITRVTI